MSDVDNLEASFVPQICEDEEEEFHTPRGRDMAEEPEVEWMYADARLLPLPLMTSFASANPFRWSRGSPDKIVVELEGLGQGWWGLCNMTRPVRLRVVGSGCRRHSHKFDTPQAAAQWLRDCERELDQADRSTTIAAWVTKFAAAPALALYCRLHSQQPWARKNLFFASSYALRVCNWPQKISAMQHLHSISHPVLETSWTEWWSSSSRSLTAFVEAAQLPIKSRPATLRLKSVVYDLVVEQCPSPFWVVYKCRPSQSSRIGEEEEKISQQSTCVAAFSGAKFEDESFSQHPASPARAFILVFCATHRRTHLHHPPSQPYAHMHPLVLAVLRTFGKDGIDL